MSWLGELKDPPPISFEIVLSAKSFFNWINISLNLTKAREIWNRTEDNLYGTNHFWERFLQYERNSVAFFDSLDVFEQHRLYEYFCKKR